jgi:hypothetical protein
MYPALVLGRDSTREHLRLCDRHFNELLNYCRSHLEEVIYDAPQDTQFALATCCVCGGDPSHGRLVFVTAYPQGHDEVQFYGQVCESDVSKLATCLLLR